MQAWAVKLPVGSIVAVSGATSATASGAGAGMAAPETATTDRRETKAERSWTMMTACWSWFVGVG